MKKRHSLKGNVYMLSVVITEQILDGFTATKGHGDLRGSRLFVDEIRSQITCHHLFSINFDSFSPICTKIK
jgi:hypothetical protein